MNNITAKDLKEAIDSCRAMTIVDLQEPDNFEHRHIPGAVNIPINENCDTACRAILKDKDAEVILYGEFDELGKGQMAVEALAKVGYTKITRLTGGLMGWMEAGYQVEGGRAS